MKLEKRADGWWITDCPHGIMDMGPYEKTAAGVDEAREDKRGVERFIKANKWLYKPEKPNTEKT